MSMLRSFRIGKLCGIPLYLHPTFFLLPAWLLLSNSGAGLGGVLFSLLALVALFGCVVLHELGHALMARHFGIGTRSITLLPIGGVASLERMSEKPFEEIAIAVAGPAVNLVLAGLLAPFALGGFLLAPQVGLLGEASGLVSFLWGANVWLFLFNLLPCFPMDGGRVLRAMLALWKGQLHATEIAVRVGLVMACLIAASSLLTRSPWPIVLAVFVLLAGQMELFALRQREAQRRAAQLIEPIPAVAAEEPKPANPPFTGLAWDSRYRVWVQWHNGQPVGYRS
jgi:Zn-dependent protease